MNGDYQNLAPELRENLTMLAENRLCQSTGEVRELLEVHDKGQVKNTIPVWRRYTLTIEEAAGYYHIGEGKLRMLIDQNPHEDFYVMNGNRALIKREKFERYLDQATAV